ncbi:MAG: nucleoside-binding protein [Leifsonia xyli]|nr:MAG: nucleoside-binding protein [Leifsonia xyli]
MAGGAAAEDLKSPEAAAATSPAGFSVTEAQFLVGRLKNPFVPGTEAWTPIVTIQHASSWSFGDVFFFVDILDDRKKDGFNDADAYGEFYAYFSSNKMFGAQYGGALKDIGAVAGVNYGADSDFRVYLPGVYADWNVPGFALFRTQLTGFIDDSKDTIGKAGSSKDGWQATLVWSLPFEIGGQYFSFEGFAEYTGLSYNKTYNAKRKDWILIEPQLRWDAGYAFTGVKNKFFLGTEYHYFRNKLGVDGVNESRFQALAVVRF